MYIAITWTYLTFVTIELQNLLLVLLVWASPVQVSSCISPCSAQILICLLYFMFLFLFHLFGAAFGLALSCYLAQLLILLYLYCYVHKILRQKVLDSSFCCFTSGSLVISASQPT